MNGPLHGSGHAVIGRGCATSSRLIPGREPSGGGPGARQQLPCTRPAGDACRMHFRHNEGQGCAMTHGTAVFTRICSCLAVALSGWRIPGLDAFSLCTVLQSLAASAMGSPVPCLGASSSQSGGPFREPAASFLPGNGRGRALVPLPGPDFTGPLRGLPDPVCRRGGPASSLSEEALVLDIGGFRSY